jgi:hypothetical protein
VPTATSIVRPVVVPSPTLPRAFTHHTRSYRQS